MPVDRDSPVPLYQQLHDWLRSRIVQGDLIAGEVIPTEMELVREFGLSRVTVRRALQLLVDEGLIIRQVGKGSFVCSHKLRENLSSLRGFAEMMLIQYPGHSMEVLGFGIVTPPDDARRHLALEAHEQVICIRRRHVLEESPLAYALIYLPLDIGGTLTPHEVAQTSIYSLIAQKLALSVHSATQMISAIGADPVVAAQLAVPVKSPVLLVRRITYSSAERPLEYIRLYYPGERHEIAMEVYRDTMRITEEQHTSQITT